MIGAGAGGLALRQAQQWARHIQFKSSLSEQAKNLALSRVRERPHGEHVFPLVSEIVGVVSHEFQVSRNDIISERRHPSIARPRQIAMYLAKDLTPFSFPKLGRQFRKEHTTVIYACNKIEVVRAADRDLDALLNSLTAKVWAVVSAREAT